MRSAPRGPRRPLGLAGTPWQQQHGDAGEQTAVPGEAGLKPAQEAEQEVTGVVRAGEHDLVPCGLSREYSGARARSWRRGCR